MGNRSRKGVVSLETHQSEAEVERSDCKHNLSTYFLYTYLGRPS